MNENRTRKCRLLCITMKYGSLLCRRDPARLPKIPSYYKRILLTEFFFAYRIFIR